MLYIKDWSLIRAVNELFDFFTLSLEKVNANFEKCNKNASLSHRYNSKFYVKW